MSPEMFQMVMGFLKAIQNNEIMPWQTLMPYLNKASESMPAYDFNHVFDSTVSNFMDFSPNNPYHNFKK